MAFFKKLKGRATEPSTWAGVAGILTGVGMITGDTSITGTASDLIGQGLQAASSGGWQMGLTVGLAGLLGVIFKEKGSAQ